MRKILIILCSVLVVSLTSCEKNESSNRRQDADKYVYITPYGTKYHHSWCRTIQGHSISKISIKKAKRRGRTQCKVCF